ncbi:MAG: hypothetical protein QM808_05095 [Steroidobacteraceae bacterium]
MFNFISARPLGIALLGGLLTVALTQAEGVDPATIKRGDTGLTSPRGETAQETAAKKVLFERIYVGSIERNAVGAFNQFFSADYCDHGHLGNGGQTECSTKEYLQSRISRPQEPLKPGEKVDVPRLATVNGDMVSMYGDGIDIFRVKEGKITDHWDASPPAEIELHANARGFPEWGVITRAEQGKRGKRTIGQPTNRQLLTAVNPGPITPYAETKQEAANKRLVFSFVFNAYVLGNHKDAVEKYVSPGFCDHSHLNRPVDSVCGTRDELIASGKGVRPARLGDRIEIPFMASVDGEIVTTYSDSVDVFRVHDGLITDHWDANPAKDIIIHAHATVVPDHLIRVIAGDVPFGTRPPGDAGSPPIAK